jgi:hypothetical protein
MKMISKTGLSLLSLVLFTAPAFAGTADIRATDRALEFQFGGSNLKYGETINGTTFDTENGWMPSFDVGATWLTTPGDSLLSDLYLHLDAQATIGQTDYDGGIQDGFGNITPFKTTTDNEIYHITGKIGHFFTVSEGVVLIPYLDLGWRSWDRNISGRGIVNNSRERYQTGEGMGGLLLQISPMQRLVLSLSGAAGATLGPQMSTQSTTFNLQSSTVWQINGKVGYALTPKFELTSEAKFDGFGFGQSAIVNNALEPDSYTHQLSLLVGLAYHMQ